MKWLDEFWWYNGDMCVQLDSLWVNGFDVCILVVVSCLFRYEDCLVMTILVGLLFDRRDRAEVGVVCMLFP